MTREMAQNYDPATGIAVMEACYPNCRMPCVPFCVTDGHRTRAVFGPPGLDFTPDNWTRDYPCTCEGYAIRTGYGTGVEWDVDRSSCEVHGGLTDE